MIFMGHGDITKHQLLWNNAWKLKVSLPLFIAFQKWLQKQRKVLHNKGKAELVDHDCNPSIWKAGAEDSSEFEISLDYPVKWKLFILLTCTDALKVREIYAPLGNCCQTCLVCMPHFVMLLYRSEFLPSPLDYLGDLKEY